MASFPKYVWEVLNKRVPVPLESKSRDEGEFLLIYNLSILGRSIIALNQTATMIYRLCDGKRTIGEIIEKMHKEYPDVPEEKLTEDTHQCIRNMEYKRLLTVVREKFLVREKPNPAAACGCC